MNVDVVLLPEMLPKEKLGGATVVVFDVLRATTTMAAALAAGVEEIHIFGSTSAARDAARRSHGVLLCGEERCLPPDGFHLGNSPGSFHAAPHRGQTVFMSTTNGTRAILAARGARTTLTGAIVNAGAVAEALWRVAGAEGNVVLQCSGTNANVAAEDVIGAGAVLHALRPHGRVTLASDVAQIAEDLFAANRSDLGGALRTTLGGRNVLAARLEPDIDFAARLDAIDAVGEVSASDPPVVRRFRPL
jgi:2-phosphosulfolactate phosphatase